MKSALESFGSNLGNQVARRAYEAQFPRLVIPRSGPPDEVEDEVTNLGVRDNDDTLYGITDSTFQETLRSANIDVHSKPSIASLIVLGHDPTYTPTLATMQPLLPILLTSMQTNVALPETLALLLTTLGPLRTTKAAPPPGMVVPLAHILPVLAGANSDPELRHITFRLLSLVLVLLPSLLRLEILRDILTDGGNDGDQEMMSPQMRVAAIGLVKEAVLAALSASPLGGEGTEANAFASPLFTRTFAPLIFLAHIPRHDPEGDVEDELEMFLESPEPLRLVESLGLYYVVLQRDVGNKVGC